MSTKQYDVAIIGGGIVGCATAMVLTQDKDISVVVLEAESKLAAHQTGNNSGVIHSGLYYKPGSLKAKNCVQGREAMYQFCVAHGIPHERCGKVVVATHDQEIPMLNTLEERGRANGLEGLRRLSAGELKEYEPSVVGIDGLFVPDTGIVDYNRVTEKFAEIARTNGCEILLNTRVRICKRVSDGLVLKTAQGDFKCKNLVNCTGLQSDRVAKMCGVKPGLRIVPFRGEYYELVPERQHLVKNLIYPVPDLSFPFLGVHFTRMIQGGVEAGPNAVLSFKREGYKKTSFSVKDSLDTFTYGGFVKLIKPYWKMGFGEMYRSFSKKAFVKALQRLIPELRSDDVHPGGAGVRAQALEPTGALVDDFRIVEAEKMIHVLNAPSPAATAAISIGGQIANMASRNFNL
ncbi:MAG: L-2-hydroxyglutarate oxidase [Candidatus Aminicenantes bacterium]|nr:L-2-hydroxyglutarate oxidase [Candidatus Aminicenantes bacterium]